MLELHDSSWSFWRVSFWRLEFLKCSQTIHRIPKSSLSWMNGTFTWVSFIIKTHALGQKFSLGMTLLSDDTWLCLETFSVTSNTALQMSSGFWTCYNSEYKERYSWKCQYCPGLRNLTFGCSSLIPPVKTPASSTRYPQCNLLRYTPLRFSWEAARSRFPWSSWTSYTFSDFSFWLSLNIWTTLYTVTHGYQSFFFFFFPLHE